jgi:hypothetical protein
MSLDSSRSTSYMPLLHETGQSSYRLAQAGGMIEDDTNISIVTEPPPKLGVHHLKIDRGILNEARMHKHNTQAYDTMFK